MALNYIVDVAGKSTKKEKEAAVALTAARMVAYNAVGNLVLPEAGATAVMVTDVTGVNGMDNKIQYAIGDQVPVLYPTHGAELNVYVGAGSAAITKGSKLEIGADGGLVVGTTNPVGVALETIPSIVVGTTKVLMEVVNNA